MLKAREPCRGWQTFPDALKNCPRLTLEYLAAVVFLFCFFEDWHCFVTFGLNLLSFLTSGERRRVPYGVITKKNGTKRHRVESRNWHVSDKNGLVRVATSRDNRNCHQQTKRHKNDG